MTITRSADLELDDPAGLHARPASAIAELAGKLDSTITIEHNGASRVIDSMVTLLTLGVSTAATLTISATGPDADNAIDQFRRLFTTLAVGTDEPDEPSEPTALPTTARGPIHHGTMDATTVTKKSDTATDALDAVAARFERQAATADSNNAQVLNAIAALARDTQLRDRIHNHEHHLSDPTTALSDACDAIANELAATSDDYLAQRANDVNNIRNAALDQLAGTTQSLQLPDHPVILVVADLPPDAAAHLDPDNIYGLVLTEAGTTSHTAILAQGNGIPTISDAAATSITTDTVVSLDTTTGALIIEDDQTLPSRPATRTPLINISDLYDIDRLPVALAANIATVADAHRAAQAGAPSIGLYRTELAYLSARHAPSTGDIDATLSAIQVELADCPITVRTFDFGADKTSAFHTGHTGPNPALDVRGIRLAQQDPAILDTQLAAIALAAQRGPIAVMAPMIATAAECNWFVERARQHLEPYIALGVMIEIPSTLFDLDAITAACDFVSIGTNDLAQYLHAADRQSAALAHLNDPYTPTLLRAVHAVADASRRNNCKTSVCGDAAGRPGWAAIAAGLGVHTLSMNPNSLDQVAAALTNHNTGVLQQLATDSLSAVDANHVRQLVTTAGLQP